jgi:peptidoglycan/xylan/chitin deacetylase (PgdA/CDA1 family)
MGLFGRAALACAALIALSGPVAAHASPAEAGSAAVTPCSAGLVALTFDDGPARGLTTKLVRILQERHVPATFFMVGSRVRTAPGAARLVARSGFTIGNHTWSHPRLTSLSNRAIRSEIRRTAREVRSNGIRPSTLMRPPYGDVDARVRADLQDLGLVPVLWNVDSGDWRGGSARQIAASILRQLRPHKSNIVLQHDGVPNSPASVDAVPIVIRAARHRGYCFARLGPRGRMVAPVPAVRSTVYDGAEAGPTPARVLLSLSTPTSRVVSVRVSGQSGSAVAGVDFVAPLQRVGFPVGTTRAWVSVPVIDDAAYEPTETFQVVLDAPSGLVIRRAEQLAHITSDDAAEPAALRFDLANR